MKHKYVVDRGYENFQSLLVGSINTQKVDTMLFGSELDGPGSIKTVVIAVLVSITVVCILSIHKFDMLSISLLYHMFNRL